MKVIVTQFDKFLDFYLAHKDENLSTSEMVDWLDRDPDFWEEKQLKAWAHEGKEHHIRGYLRKIPDYDEQGRFIRPTPVKRPNPKHPELPFIDVHIPGDKTTYQDKVMDIERHLKLSRHHGREAVRLYGLYMENSPRDEQRKLQRRFQGVLDLDWSAIDAIVPDDERQG